MASQQWEDIPRRKPYAHRRTSSDYERFAPDQRHSIDGPQGRRPNRASVQTTHTEAPTESTFSPQSPDASIVQAHGLAPRPVSYSRANRNTSIDGGSRPYPQTQRFEQHAIPPVRGSEDIISPPEAPEIPGAQATAHQYAHPVNTYAYPSGDDIRQAIPRSSANAAGEVVRSPAEYYIRPSGNAAPQRYPELGPGPIGSQPRRASTNTTGDRRKNMTKEEKRARMQAAEQRARQRQASKTAAAATPEEFPIEAIPHTVPRQRQTSLPETSFQRTEPVLDIRRSRQHAAPQQVSVPSQPRREVGEPTRNISSASRQAHDLPRIDIPENTDAGIPKRNLSFKARAARGEKLASPIRMTADKTQYDARRYTDAPVRSVSHPLRHEPPFYARDDEVHDPRAYQNVEQYLDHDDDDDYDSSKILSVPKHLLKEKELPPLPRDERAIDRQAVMPVASSAAARAVEPAYDEFGSVSSPTNVQESHTVNQSQPNVNVVSDAPVSRKLSPQQQSTITGTSKHGHHISNFIFKSPESYRPGDGLYNPPQWLDEWKKATVGLLSGTMLNINEHAGDRKAWWEEPTRRPSKSSSTRRKAEAFDGEYDVVGASTRFKPPLYVKCGPLLRYCGIRREARPPRTQRVGSTSDREIWRGSVMIVTNDQESSYEIAPILRLFVQEVELLPAPPQKVEGDLSPEYVDPIAGHPKLGRRGETLYVRPVEELEEGKDISRDETDNGLFEKAHRSSDEKPLDGAADLPGSFTSRRKRIGVDGEKVQKYRDIRGFRLHAERGCTFWRFNIEVELREQQQRVAYRINRGPAMGFWVPAQGEAMNIMFHSCNGFSASVNPDDFTGPDPMWRDVLNTHQTKPFHVMVGGGDQIYNDCIASESELFDAWLDIRNPVKKHTASFTPELQDQLEECYLERYCMWFSQGLFGLATSQIPMVNMYDDHDVYDGYGSYPHHDMKSPVMSGLGSVAFKYYMLFQHQSVMTETESTEPSWIMGINPGPYIKELSHSVFVSLGGKVALLAVDTRTERTEDTVVDDKTWEKITNRLYSEVRLGQIDHLLVVMGVPIAYPRLVWLENILTSRLLDPVKALGKAGMLGNVLNHIDGGVEILDDLNDHWTAKNHKHERSIIMEDLQDLAMDKSVRITLLSGDVHLAAVGQFYSNPQLGLVKHKDPRYMPNIISSAIVNTPPPDLMADVLNKRNKVHHFDRHTDENMIPMFHHGVDGKPRNNKHLLPHRNWCSIRVWSPGDTPPPTPPDSSSRSSSPSPSSQGGGLFRRFSQKKQGSQGFDMSRESVRGPRPPISGGGGLFRRFSRKNSTSQGHEQQPTLTRTMSLGSSSGSKRGLFGLGRRASESHSVEPSGYTRNGHDQFPTNGSVNDEYTEGDDAYFSPTPPRRSQTLGSLPPHQQDPMTKPFHRTPTGLTAKQLRKPQNSQVDVEGGLDICLNVEVNPKDPTGITVPYRLLVPRLQYTYQEGDETLPEPQPSGIKRFLSFKKKKTEPAPPPPASEYTAGDEEDTDDGRHNMI
ncbi:hypothetical protein VHEMI03765 [[Torrubiella] hemipterigena]|uniref:PhoD-like phosphatase domain-containing protein n=1 Tax=[Torrubiella] hemipterigena TaxID=1531966 RepID=A0A0A1TED4_9HYPO|nr:hypothetical protein VHEMI03765 [[Torrubiella] hemipterigena]